MKLTIKLENGSIKVVELNKDLEFTVAKGEQYIFSNGFTNYVLNFKDDQESIILVFNVDGKSIQVVLNGIVPHLQDNIPGMDNPTAVIINKNVDDEKLDNIMENTAFNGSEILDQLALLSSKPVDLALDGEDNLSLITSFESLVGSLGAAAAGPDAGGETNSDGSTFNTIFGNIDDPLSSIAASDSWENLPESISSTGIETDGTPVIPTISISDSTVNETDGQISFVITLDQATSNTVLVNFSTADGTALSGLDYTASSGSIIFLPGEVSKTINIPVNSDNIYEISENLLINLDAPINATISDNQAVGTLIDTNLPSFSIHGVEVIEGEYAVFTVDLDNASARDIIISLATKDGTATQNDYLPQTEVLINGSWIDSTSVTIPAGETSVQVRVKTLNDALKEPLETFQLEGTLSSGLTSNTSAIGTSSIADNNIITSDDTALVSIAGEQTIVEGETSTAYTVSVDQPAADVTSPITVEITYSGVAADGKDFTKVASVTIPAGSNSVDFNITTLDDVLAEGSEVFTMTIGNITDSNFEHIAAKTGANSVDTTIVDNDSLSMNIESVQVDEDALLGTDDLDNYDPDIKEFTGSLGLNADNLAEVNLMFEGGQATSLTSKGEMIDLNYSNGNETIKGVSKDGREIFEVSLNESTGEYTFKLKDVVDHPDVTSEDLISNIDFNVIAVKGSEITSSKINVSIADDIPTANTVVIDADSQYTETTTNIVIGIDTSGSMGTTKMNLAKEAAIKLIEKYEQMGNVNVKVVEFNTNASATTWFTDSQSAKNSINGLTAGGYTNYEDTLRQTIDTFDTNSDPKPSADQDIFYMLSDGDPTKGDMNGSDGISGIVPEWKTFAESNFDDVYSIGIGNNVDLDGNSRGSLEQIADVNNGHDTFVVKDVNDLTDELLATIVNINGVLVINTGGNELDFSFGADGPADGSGPKLDGGKLSFTWGDGDLSDGSGVIINNGDGTGPNLVWSVFNNGKVILGKDATSGQVLVKIEANNVNSDNPTYEVTQFVPNTGITKVEVPFTVVDGDGDGATANLSIDIDSDFKAFVKLTGDSTAVEADGATLEHTLSLVDQNGDPINLRAGQVVTVELKYENDSTEANDFASAKTITAVITGTVDGVNSVQVINNIQDDLISEGNESYTLSIQNISTNVAGLGTVFAHETNGVKDSVTGTITDDSDTVTVILEASTSALEDGGVITYTAKLVDASNNPVVTSEIITVELENGETITIPANSSTGSTPVTVNRDDVYKENDSITNSIKTITGGTSFENLEANKNDVVTTINDDVDVVTASISGDTSVVEGNAASYSIELKDTNDSLVIAKEDMVVVLEYTYVDTATNQDITEKATVTIPNGQSKVDFDISTINDALFEGNETYKIKILSVSNTSKFEQFDIDTTPVSTLITDDESLTMTVESAQVDEDALINTSDNDGYNTVKIYKGSYDFNTNLDVDVSFKVGQTTSLTSKGETIILQLSADKNTLVGVSGNREIFEITLDENNNEYTFTLKDVVDHGDITSEDLVNLPILLEGSTVIGNISQTLNVSIADDIVTIDDTNKETVSLDNSQFTNMIINGSFENITGFRTSTSQDEFVENQQLSSGSWVGLQSMEGWELLSKSSMWMEPHEQSHASVGADDGTTYMDLGETNSNDSDIENTHIGQIITCVKDGQVYDLSFAFRDKAFTQANEADSGKMEVIWNGEVIATVDGNNTSWETMNLQITGGSGDDSNRLEFKEIGEGNDNWGMALDDIKMTLASSTHTGNLTNNQGLDVHFGADGKGSFELGTKNGWTLNADKNTLTKDDNSASITINKTTGEYTVTQTGTLPEGNINIPVIAIDGDGDKANANIVLNSQNQQVCELPDSITVKVIDSDTVAEGDTLAHRVKLYDANGNEVAVPAGEYVEVTLAYTASTVNGATENTDYTSQNTVRIYGGTSGTYIFNDTLNDSSSEGSESYIVSVSNVSASNPTLESKLTASSETVTGTITDNDVTISIEAPADVDENATEVIYTLRVDSAPNGNLDVTVNVNGTAQVVTILDGQTSVTFNVPVRADDAYSQADDTITANITSHSGGNYQDVNYNNSDNTVVISDDNDATIITTTADVSEVHAIPHGISHVIYTLADGYTVKVDNYGGDIKNPTDPMKFIDSIEAQFNQNVSSYTIKAGTKHYDSEGKEVTSIPNQADNEYSYNHFAQDTSDILTSAQVVYTLTLSNVAQSDVTITTNHGNVLIKAGETTGTISVSSSGATNGSTNSLNVQSATGGNFEAFDYTNADITVSIDNTKPVAEDRHFDLDCSTDTYSTGLKSEYYGVDSQIHNLTEFKAIVDANNPDATFTATNINYGYGNDNGVSTGTSLQEFLKGDAASLSNDPADTSDGGIKLYGKVFLAAGTYNFKVYADDGYDITVNGQNVADFETNQSPGTKVHNDFTIAEDGYYDIEMLWWDQGGAYVFQPQISSDGGATYKFLDSSMLFTQETSTSDASSVEFKMENFVADIEDDANSTIVKIRIESLPEDGVLTVNGTAVKVGDIYDETTVIKYTANSNIEDTLYGTTADSGTLAEWGTITNGVLTTDDGNATIKAYSNNVLGEIGFSSQNNNNHHDGLGLGVVGSTDDDQIELDENEKIVMEFKEVVTNAEFGLASLGSHFTPGATQNAKAHWVAYKDGVEVASGDVQQSTDDSNDTTNSFKIDVEFDKIEFTTTANVNSNYSIQYMNIDYKVDDSFDYVAIDSDDKESDSAKVTIDLETTGCTIRNENPLTTDDSISTAEDTAIVLALSDFGTYSDNENDAIKEVSIETLPTNGVITLDGTAITVGMKISVSDITSNKLVFTPSEHSDEDGSFTFKVSDSQDNWSSIHTTSVEVTAVADKPSVSLSLSDGVFVDGGTTTTQSVTEQENVNVKLGHQYGDNNIYGTNGTNYRETTSKVLDFGVENAGKTIELTMDVTVKGSWNFSSSYYDDNWSVFVNNEQKAVYKYSSQSGQTPSNYNESTNSSGIVEYEYGNAGENSSFTKNHQTPVLLVTLDENGRANLTLAASTTEKAETVTFNWVKGVIPAQTVELEDKYEYTVDIASSLVDKDGSESLSVKIEGVPLNAEFTPSTGMTNLGNGIWELIIPAGQKEVTLSNLKMLVPESETTFTLKATATATEANDTQDTKSAMASISNTEAPVITVSLGVESEVTTQVVQRLEDLESLTTSNSGNNTYVAGNANSKLELDSNNNDQTVQINGNLNNKLELGDGDDTINIDGSSSNEIKLNRGDDKLNIDGNANNKITMNTGNYDQEIRIGGSLNNNDNTTLNMGAGDDTLDIHGSLNRKVELGSGADTVYIEGNSNQEIKGNDGADSIYIKGNNNGIGNKGIDTGDDNDTVYVGGSSNAKIKTGDNNDTIIIEGNVSGGNDGKIDAGSGNDIVSVEGRIYTEIKGGSGNDVLFVNMTQSQWNSFNDKNNVKEFETIVFNDGTHTGDASLIPSDNPFNFNPFVSSSTTKTYEYPVNVSIANNDNASSEFKLSFENLPADSKLYQNGVEIVANGSDEYVLNTTDISGIKISSPSQITNEDGFEIKVSSSEEDINTLFISDEGDDDTIDLSTIINNTNTDVDVLDVSGTNINTKLDIDIDDLIADNDKELVVKGSFEGKVDLDNTEWTNSGTQEIDGANYNVYKGLGANSTVKLLIDDDIEITPDI